MCNSPALPDLGELDRPGYGCKQAPPRARFACTAHREHDACNAGRCLSPPLVIEDLARRLGRHPAVERVWLFGSRARGDNFERSDIDLAIEAPGMDDYEWLKIKLDFEDQAPTFLLVNLVRFEDAPQILREQILDEGIVVHERTRAQTAV